MGAVELPGHFVVLPLWTLRSARPNTGESPRYFVNSSSLSDPGSACMYPSRQGPSIGQQVPIFHVLLPSGNVISYHFRVRKPSGLRLLVLATSNCIPKIRCWTLEARLQCLPGLHHLILILSIHCSHPTILRPFSQTSSAWQSSRVGNQKAKDSERSIRSV